MEFSAFLFPRVAAVSVLELGEAVIYAVFGFLIVLITLLALALASGFFGQLFVRIPWLARAGSGASGARERSETTLPPRKSDDRTGQITAIAAAVDQALGGRYRVVSARHLGSSEEGK